MLALAGSVIGVLVLVLLARGLGFATDPLLADAGAAQVEAAAALPGFQPQSAVLSSDRRAAIVRGRGGGVALVRPMGDKWVVRKLEGARFAREGNRLHVTLAEPQFPATTLIVPPLPWLEQAA
jgi:hypothetical protein